MYFSEGFEIFRSCLLCEYYFWQVIGFPSDTINIFRPYRTLKTIFVFKRNAPKMTAIKIAITVCFNRSRVSRETENNRMTGSVHYIGNNVHEKKNNKIRASDWLKTTAFSCNTGAKL